jgi:hypothetical protein
MSYPVNISDGLMERLEPLLSRRRLQIEEVVEFYLNSLVIAEEKGKVFGLDDIMPIGKFKGSRIGDIVKIEPRYMGWLISESSTFFLDHAAQRELNSVLAGEGYDT